MVIKRHPVVPKNIDLLRDLLTTDEPLLEFTHLINPSSPYSLSNIVCELRVFEILRIAIDWVNRRIALAVCTFLL